MYQTALDIYNRALQHLGKKRIYSLTDANSPALELGFCYDKMRDAELRRATWRHAIRRAVLRPVDTSTVIFTPATWAATTTYAAGAIVSYTPTTLNISEAGANPVPYYWYVDKAIAGLAANPTPDVAIYWHRYFGPVTLNPFVAPSTTSSPSAPTTGTSVAGALSARTYSVKVTYITTTGETVPSDASSQAVAANSVLTITSPVASTGATAYHVYVGLSEDEETLQTGSAAITIGVGWTEPVTGAVIGRGQPLAPTGTLLPGFWAQELTLLGTTIYSSLVSNNIDVPPTGNWLAQSGTILPATLLYPIGASYNTWGTSDPSYTYHLPHGFLRKAPTDPASDIGNYVGAPAGRAPEDWVFEGNYIVSHMSGALMLRFCADVIDVYDFDPLFCEAVAAKLATQVVQMLVDKENWRTVSLTASREYKTAMAEAHRANSVLIGHDADPLTRYILARF